MSNNKIFQNNGLVVLDQFGAAQAVPDAAAPGVVDFTPTVVISESNPRSATVTIAAGDYSAYSKVVVAWLAVNSQGQQVKGMSSFAPGSGGDIVIAGSEEDVFGSAAGLTIIGYELSAVLASNGLMGPSKGLYTITQGAGNPVAPQFADTLTIIGPGVEDQEHTASLGTVLGSPAPTVVLDWRLDGVSTGDTGLTCTPANPGVLDYIATATNTVDEAVQTSTSLTIVAADTAPVISAETITGDPYIGSLLTVSYTVTGNPVPTVTLQWQIGGVNQSGETGTTFIPTAGGTVSCEIAATNSVASDTAEPTIAVSALPAPTAADWDITEVVAAGATGRRWTKTYLNPSLNAARAWWTTQPLEVLTNPAFPFPFGCVEMELTDAVNGIWATRPSFNISSSPAVGNVGNGRIAGDSSVTGPATITATATNATTFSITGAVTGTATVGTKFESGNIRFTIVAGTIAFQAGDVLTGIVDTTDFTIYDPDPPGTSAADVLRQSRARIVYTIASGARSPFSEDAKTVPQLPTIVTNQWYPMQARTAAEFNLGIIGGQGRQRFRFVARSAGDPKKAWFGMDVNGGPFYTGNSGEYYSAPQMQGVTNIESCAGIWMDPVDSNRIVYAASAGDMRSTTTTANVWDLVSGLYLSTDNGLTFIHVLQLTNIPSCSASGERDNRSLFVHSSGGGTPTTRTIYYLHKPRPKGGAWGTGRIYKSTNGGQTWAAHGESLTNAKFGNKVYWFDRDPSGNLYIASDSGLFKSTDDGASFTVTGINTGPVLIVNAYHGGTNVWAAKQGTNPGAYQATNAAATTYSRNANLGNYDIAHLAVCPANASRIMVAADTAGSDGKWTHNGGTSWGNIVNRSSTGATNVWAAKPYGEGALFSWTPGSQTEVLLCRAQHLGKSVDGGASTDWSANGMDLQTRKFLGVDPLNWEVMACGTQDTTASGSMDGYNTSTEAGTTSAQRTTLLNGGVAMAGNGGLILRNGSHRAIITAGGGDRTQRLPMRHNSTATNFSDTVTLIGTNRSGCEFSGLKPGDNSIGWIGRNRFKLESNGTLTQQSANMGQEFYGSTSTAGRIIGGPTNPGNGRTLYVSTNSGDTWSVWGTSPVRFCIPYGTPSAIAVSRFSANRVWVGEAFSGTGRVFKMEGSTPTNTLIFTLADQPGFSNPVTEIHSIREDPLDETVLYMLAYAAGASYIWMVRNALTTPTVTDITYNAPRRAISWLHVHLLTGDLLLGAQFGSRILRCRSDFAGPDAGKWFDRVKAYVDANIGPGVEI